jgi:glycosyltransferase involved in cell wall biosynthesis
MYKQQNVSVVIPALNEAPSIHQVVCDLLSLEDETGLAIIDEVVVCDNGSTDDTAKIAKSAGARVVFEPTPGYGRACINAISALQQTGIVLFVDADHAFYAHQAVPLLDAIVQGSDLAIGSRVLGKMELGALTVPQQFGNRLAGMLVKLIWHRQITDLGPFRAIRYNALKQMKMQDKTFGWTIEMQIKAIQLNMITAEIPVDTRCRIGVSKISGTLKGSLGAGIGILGMIAKMWWHQKATNCLANPNILVKQSSPLKQEAKL